MKWYVFHENVFPNNSTIIENQKMEMVQFNKKKKQWSHYTTTRIYVVFVQKFNEN